ncbi:MAG: glycogen/starch synthase [Steroidobacteraceae bacterium]
MLAAETAAFRGGKIGGVADVVHGASRALHARGWRVDVLIPGHAAVLDHVGQRRSEGVVAIGSFRPTEVAIESVLLPCNSGSIRYLLLRHPLFEANGIYSDDGPMNPFATDATKYALFCLAAGEALCDGVIARPEVLHLHDWHAAAFLAFRGILPRWRGLARLHTVFTIHNLAIQGIRPFAGVPSSLDNWLPRIRFDRSSLADPRWPDCFNPMAAAIRKADRVHTVSPSYAREIIRPNSDGPVVSHGGEGLEADLQSADVQGRLHGILNGCDYPARLPRRTSWANFLRIANDAVRRWASRTRDLRSAHYFAAQRLAALSRKRPRMILDSVGRLVAQKAELFLGPASGGKVAIRALLDAMADNELLIILGSGDVEFEARFTEFAATEQRLLFLCGYDELLADELYRQGDLFLMPSSFEPCGISQMLAMRAGQPCVAHAVGGLRDTISHEVTGWLFDGSDLTDQADNFVAAVAAARTTFHRNPDGFRAMRREAARQRFDWASTAQSYERLLYSTPTVA